MLHVESQRWEVFLLYFLPVSPEGFLNSFAVV